MCKFFPFANTPIYVVGKEQVGNRSAANTGGRTILNITPHREGGREGGMEGGRKGVSEGGKEGGREGAEYQQLSIGPTPYTT